MIELMRYNGGCVDGPAQGKWYGRQNLHTRRGNFEGEKWPAEDMPRLLTADILKASQR